MLTWQQHRFCSSAKSESSKKVGIPESMGNIIIVSILVLFCINFVFLSTMCHIKSACKLHFGVFCLCWKQLWEICVFLLEVSVLSQPLHEFCTVPIAYKIVYISVSTLSNTNDPC